LKTVILIFVAALLGAGCSPSTKKKEWSEEVDVGAGNTIVVNRAVEFETSNSWSGDAYSQTELESTLSLENQVPSLPVLSTVFMPIVLYQDPENQQWVVVATTFSCVISDQHGRPRPPYWEYRLVNGAWKLGSLSPMSFGRRANLFFRYDEEVPESPIKVTTKSEILKRSRLGETYKQIVIDAKPIC
jgi:hypothetical protein